MKPSIELLTKYRPWQRYRVFKARGGTPIFTLSAFLMSLPGREETTTGNSVLLIWAGIIVIPAHTQLLL